MGEAERLPVVLPRWSQFKIQVQAPSREQGDENSLAQIVQDTIIINQVGDQTEAYESCYHPDNNHCIRRSETLSASTLFSLIGNLDLYSFLFDYLSQTAGNKYFISLDFCSTIIVVF